MEVDKSKIKSFINIGIPENQIEKIYGGYKLRDSLRDEIAERICEWLKESRQDGLVPLDEQEVIKVIKEIKVYRDYPEWSLTHNIRVAKLLCERFGQTAKWQLKYPDKKPEGLICAWLNARESDAWIDGYNKALEDVAALNQPEEKGKVGE